MPSFGQLFALRAAGEAVNAITPTAYLGGEPVKAWLLSRRGVPVARGLASVLVSKTALMLTQGFFVLLGLLVALGRWQTAVPVGAATAIGTSLALLLAVVVIGIQRHGPFTLLLSLSRRLSGREPLLASWEAEVTALDGLLRDFYHARTGAFLVCCALHFLGWVAGCFEVFLTLRLLNAPIDFLAAFSIEALSGVAKLAALFVPGSLLRRGRELLWVGFGLMVVLHHHALRWMREQNKK